MGFDAAPGRVCARAGAKTTERGVARPIRVDFALFSLRATRYIPARMIDVPRPGGTLKGDCG